jgi:ABC-type glutathione transport system ATPase component
VLLVDEVLAVGDANFARKCLARIAELRTRGATVVLVSHDAPTVRAFCQRALVLKQGKLVFEGDAASALEAHQAIMEERYLAHLSQEERAEERRIEALRSDAAARSMGFGSPIPDVALSARFVQDEKEGTAVDVARPFVLRVTLHVEHPERFGDEISVGFGMTRTDSGARLGGHNNLHARSPVSLQALKGSRHATVDFAFEQGLPCLGAGNCSLVVGVHDGAITRSILTKPVLDFVVTNSLAGKNYDNDPLWLGRYVSSIALSCEG